MEICYFTCTLGRAAQWKKTTDRSLKSFDTILDLIDEQAAALPDQPAIGFAKCFDAHAESCDHLTFSELRDASIKFSTCLKIAVWGSKPAEKGLDPIIGLLCTSSLNFVLTWLGLMRLACRPMLFAPQLDAVAIEHLCRACGITKILVDCANRTLRAANLGSDTVAVVNIPAIDLANDGQGFHSTLTPTARPRPHDTAYLMHTSGTSSGLPKPIEQSHWGAVGCLPCLSSDGEAATFTTTPLYHGGLADCFRAWTSGAMIWFFPEGDAPITGQNVRRAVKYARQHKKCKTRVAYFSSVPYVLQAVDQEGEEGLTMLRSMDVVGVGGAALPVSIGDALVSHGVRLISRLGSAECGFLLSSERDYAKDCEWQYFRVNTHHDDDTMLAFEPREDGLAELVVRPGWPLRLKTNRPDASYATSDLFEPHASLCNAWRYHSRADAQIALANGKKFDPSPLEAALLAGSSALLEDVLVFGQQRHFPGALLFTRNEHFADGKVVEAVWPCVQAANESMPAYACLSRASLAIVRLGLSRSSGIAKSSKGSVMSRWAVEHRYKNVIDRVYESGPSQQVQYCPSTHQDVADLVAEAFTKVLGRQLNPDQDLFRQGVDSIACIQVRRLIESNFVAGGASGLPLNVIYDQGTVNALVAYLKKRCQFEVSCAIDAFGGQTTDNHNHDDTLTQMQDMAMRYSQFNRVIHLDQSKELESESGRGMLGEAIVLTGATGALGAHILHELLVNRHRHLVRRIYCLVRAASSKAAQQRVYAALSRRGLSSSENMTQPVNLLCLACDLTRPKLGLTEADWRRMKSDCTHILHAAWTVNFSLSLSSMEDQIQGLRHLIELSEDCTIRSGCPRLFFISSTASVSASPEAKTTGMLERISILPSDASPLGYSRSKWVAERVCAAAHDQGVAHVSILRLGQLCGNAAGIWNRSEAWPMMLSTAALVKCLPHLENQPLDWLPVDQAARAVLELVLQETESGSKHLSVYHVLNPHRQPVWSEMLRWLQQESGGSAAFQVVQPAQWLQRLREKLTKTGTAAEREHPSGKLLSFWEASFVCEGEKEQPPIFDMRRSFAASKILRGAEPLSRGEMLKMWAWIYEKQVSENYNM